MSALDQVSNAKLRSEFVRALNVVQQTQLTLFRETPIEHRSRVESRFESAWLDRRQEAVGVAGKDDLQAQIMRETLADLLDGFNDPFANYLYPEVLARYHQRRKGNFVGIGIKFRARSNAYPLVIGPLLGGPLEHAGIEPGDEIRQVAGIDQYAASSRQIAASLKGEQGSEVVLRLARRGREKDTQLSATRQKVTLEYVRSEALANARGYLRISRFGGRTHNTVAAHLQKLIQHGVSALVLDLRDNPGGSTRAARAVVSLFSQQPHVYTEQFKSGKIRRLERNAQQLTDMPLAVLVNERSMSSAEIVAGAFKASGRASVVGAPTYGKGLIQRVFDLKEPLGGAIRSTIAVYATLDDVLIQGVGVVPDVYVPSSRENLFRETGSLNISAAARRFRRQLLNSSIRANHSTRVAGQLIAQPDQQLERALSLLDGEAG